jgi:hypothetical protein
VGGLIPCNGRFLHSFGYAQDRFVQDDKDLPLK